MIVLDDLIPDMISNKKFHPVDTVISLMKLNIVILPCTKKCKTKHHTAFYNEGFKKARDSTNGYWSDSSDIDFKGFMDLQKKCAVKKYSFFSH